MLTDDPHYCGACDEAVQLRIRIGRNYARWYVYTHPSSKEQTWGQICAACLKDGWRSMDKSHDDDRRDYSEDVNHDVWKNKLFDAVIRKRLSHDPRGEHGHETDYKLAGPIRGPYAWW